MRCATREEPTSEPRSNVFRFVRAAVGDLRPYLEVRRAAGHTFDAIARELSATAGIFVSSTTIAAWAKRLGIHEPQRKAS